MAENLSQSELDYPFKLLEYFNGFRVSKVTFMTCFKSLFSTELPPSCRNLFYVDLLRWLPAGPILDPKWCFCLEEAKKFSCKFTFAHI